MQKGLNKYKKGDNPAAIFHLARAARLLTKELAQGIKVKGAPGGMSVDKYLKKESKLRLAYSFRANAYSKLGNENRAKISQTLADQLID
jgi:hypothetical protein